MKSNPYVVTAVMGFMSFFLEIFIPQIILSYKLKRRPYFWFRLAAVLAASVGFVFMPYLRISFIGLSFILVVAYSVLAAWFLFKVNLVTCLFSAASAWAIQHIAWELLMLVCYLAEMSVAVTVVVYFIFYIAAYTVFFFVFAFRRPSCNIKTEQISVLLNSFLIVCITCFLHDFVGRFESWSLWYTVFAIVCCTLVLFNHYGLMMRESLKSQREELKREKAVLEGLIYLQSKQYELSGETVEIINRKCHDLKHQISVLRKMDKSQSDEFYNELEKTIMVYGDIAKTGNEALDITLTEKCLLCDEYKIKFSYIVDGESLSVMQPVDVSSMFGNILDNAIECARGEEEGKRIIKLNVAPSRGYLKIHCENYCSHEVAFDDNLPVTDKSTDYHGYGVKSIRYLAEKYGGSLVMEQDDGIFNVNILLPVPDKN